MVNSSASTDPLITLRTKQEVEKKFLILEKSNSFKDSARGRSLSVVEPCGIGEVDIIINIINDQSGDN